MIDYVLKRRNRRTVAIKILRDGTVEVHAPSGYPKTEIDSFVSSKEEWIEKHSLPRLERVESKKNFSVNFGDKLLYLGREYPLVSVKSNRAGFDNEKFYAPEELDSDALKEAVKKIYKKLAKDLIVRKVSHYSEIMQLFPTSVKVNSAKTHWGSCSGKGSLNFSWKLIMADEETVDYVIVHEIAHIKELNHSKAFWETVGNVMPDYEKNKQKLKALQMILMGQDWD